MTRENRICNFSAGSSSEEGGDNVLRLVPQQSRTSQVSPPWPCPSPPAFVCLSLELGLSLSPILCWAYRHVKMLEDYFLLALACWGGSLGWGGG